jgi:hypothetical protein
MPAIVSLFVTFSLVMLSLFSIKGDYLISL